MDLYKQDLSGIQWGRPCGGNQDAEEMDSCVEIAEFPGGVALRDSKRPDLPPLRFTDDEVRAFVRAYGD